MPARTGLDGLHARFGRDATHAEWFYGFRRRRQRRDVASDLLDTGLPPRDLLLDKGFTGKAFAAGQADRGTADDLWAVGRGPPGHAVALHWDGQDWQQLPVAAPESGTVKLCDVAELAGNDIWAAGYRTAPEGGVGTRQPFAVHWNGRAWSPGELPAGPGQIWQLVKDGVSIWGIGYAPDSMPIVARMSGSAWQFLPGPASPPGARHGSLFGGAILPDGGLLIVGATSTSPDAVQPFAAVCRGYTQGSLTGMP